MVGKKQIWNFITGYRVVSEMMIIWSSAANTGIKSYIERLIWNEFGLKVSCQWKLLHWGTGRYHVKWIQVPYIKLKEIWPLFSIAKTKKKKTSSFLWMKANLSPNLALKLAPTENYFNEDLVGCLVVVVNEKWG